MAKFVELVSSYRWCFISFIVILTCFFAYNAKGVKTDNSIEIWLKQDDPALLFYNKFKQDFGNEEFLLIAIDNENIFSKESIRLITKISSEIKKLDGISDVTSLSTIFKQKINTPYFKELLNKNKQPNQNKKDTSKSSTLAVFRQELLNDPLYVNNVISEDGKTTAIIAMVKGPAIETSKSDVSESKENWPEFRKTLVLNVKKIITDNIELQTTLDEKETKSFIQTLISKFILSSPQHKAYPNIYIAGPTAINAELDSMSQNDLAMFVPLMFCIAFIVLIILFKKATGVILPMVVIGISNVWAMGLYGACGNTMNMVSGIITPVIFVIGLATCIHIINNYYFESSSNNIQSTVKNIGVPCFFTCLTTSLGFLSLMSSDVAPVRITGGFTAAGIMISFFIAIVLITITFIYLGTSRSKRRSGKMQQKTEVFYSLLHRISSFVCNRTWFVLILSILLIIASICGILRLKVESDIIKAFPTDSDIIKANNHIENKLTGLLPLEFIASVNNNESITNPKTLRNLEDFQKFLIGIDEVTFTISIVDIIKKVNQTINKGDPRHYSIPESYDKANIYLNMASLYGRDVVDNLYTKDKTAARISMRMKQVGSERYSGILGQIRDYIANNISQNLSIKITGVVHLLIEMQDYLIASQIKTLSLAFVIIFVVMIFLLQSVKLALISMIPNIIPIIFTIGAMGYMGIMLDSGTIMVASVAIGIAVDDTIHFLYRFKKEMLQRKETYVNPDQNSSYNAKQDYIISIEQTLRHVGRAIIFTSIIAFCGFLALCLSQFKPIQYFGLLTAITMVNALIADLFVLPSCLLIFRPRL